MKSAFRMEENPANQTRLFVGASKVPLRFRGMAQNRARDVIKLLVFVCV